MSSIYKNSRLIILTVLFSTFTLINPVFAANDAMLDLLKILRDKGSLTQDEYDILANAAAADEEKAQSATNQTKAEFEEIVLSIPKITTNGKFEVAKDDWKWRIGGRVQHDVTIADSDARSLDGLSGNEFRRARFYLQGTAFEDWDFKLQFDLEDADDGSQTIEDAYVRYTGFDWGTVTLGQIKAPYGLNEMTSSKYITFIERSVPSNFFASAAGLGDRQPGITLATGGDNWAFQGGYYLSRQTDATHPQAVDAGNGFTGRLAYFPIAEKDRALHLAISAGYRSTSDGNGRLRVRPGVNSGPRIIDTDVSLMSTSTAGLGVEAFGMYGPFSVQGEYYDVTFKDIIGGAGDVDADGYYVYGSYFLTGENRNYSKGGFSSVKPNNNFSLGNSGIGAWEVALRYSSMELDDKPVAGVGGDEGDTFTAALNWYVNPSLMFKFNYVTTLDCTNCDWGAGVDPSYVVLRSQIFW